MLDSIGSYPAPKTIPECKRSHYNGQWEYLKRVRDAKLSTWYDLTDFILPNIGMRFDNDSPREEERYRKGRVTPVLINNTATIEARNLQSNLMSGMTPPSRPWFKMKVPDPEAMKDQDCRLWLKGYTESILYACQISNYYDANRTVFREVPTYGVALKILDEDEEFILNNRNIPLGTYCIAHDDRGILNLVYRETEFSVGQLVSKWGLERVSLKVRNDYDQGNYLKYHPVMHVIEPNRLFQAGSYGLKGMKHASVYYERNCDTPYEQLLSVKGYNEFPATAPRWDLLSGDTYGTGPGADTLGDIKALQVLEMRKAQGIDKQVTPPLQGPKGIAQRQVGHLPGSFTGTDYQQGGSQAISSLYNVQIDLAGISVEIERHENRIKRAYLTDLLMAGSAIDQHNVKARQVEEVHQEKLMAAGPMFDRLISEMITPDVRRIAAILKRRGVIPPAPERIRGQNLIVHYTSLLAQAQQAVSIGSIESTTGFAGQMGAVNSMAFDLINVDETIREYSNALGTPANVLNSPEVVRQLREDRQKQIEQKEQASQTGQAIEGAKVMSETDLTDPSMLNYLIGNAGGQS